MEHYSDIIRARKIIRQKFKELRQGDLDKTIALEKTFKPLSDPLKALLEMKKKKTSENTAAADNIKPQKNQKLNEEDGMKDRAEGEDDDPLFEDAKSEMDDDERVPSPTSPRKEYEDLQSFFLRRYGHNLGRYLHNYVTNSSEYDRTGGVRADKRTKQWYMGNKPVSFHENNSMEVENARFFLTDGLLELVFKKKPVGYTQDDLKIYKDLLEVTNAHRRAYDADKVLRSNRSFKYMNIIKPMYKKQGGGLFVPYSQKDKEYVYWDSVDELVDRLYLLHSSTEAGHNGLSHEIRSIEQELREANIIQ